MDSHGFLSPLSYSNLRDFCPLKFWGNLTTRDDLRLFPHSHGLEATQWGGKKKEKREEIRLKT